jgi:hypothetical protein
MPKATLNSNIFPIDTIQAINEPVTVTATTAGGLTVTVPATTEVGSIVVLNSDGTAFETLLVEGFNLFSPVDAAADITVIG